MKYVYSTICFVIALVTGLPAIQLIILFINEHYVLKSISISGSSAGPTLIVISGPGYSLQGNEVYMAVFGSFAFSIILFFCGYMIITSKPDQHQDE
ncbi:MAG: hypothetical protein COA79_18920 [Planctomycetota bacterium]|nr:MAG: hypothetical protein COA79_18920 [Planctomycetota bacterium]